MGSGGTGSQILKEAVRSGKRNRVLALLKMGYTPYIRDLNGNTLLHIAAENGRSSVADLLMRYGLRVDERNRYGVTPLHKACENGKLKVVKVLADRGADLGTTDSKGETPLHKAVMSGHLPVVKFLLARGAPVNAPDERDNTPLHRAVESSDRKIVRILVSKGADPKAQNRQGKTPIDIATKKGDYETLSILLRGVRVSPTTGKSRSRRRSSSPPPRPNLPPISSLCKWDARWWINREISGYRVSDIIGCGGNSVVLRARGPSREVAMKIPILCGNPCNPAQANPSHIPSVDVLEIFAEVTNLLRVVQNYPNSDLYLVKVLDIRVPVDFVEAVKRDPTLYLLNPPFIAMEMMEGGDSTQLLKEPAIVYSSYWDEVTCRIGKMVGKGVSILHRSQFVHLDIKPQNVFLSSTPPHGGREILESLMRDLKVKLGDLGSSVRVGERFISVTESYASVEQVVNAILTAKGQKGRGADYPMDIYSLGSTLYRIRTGKTLNIPVLDSFRRALETLDPRVATEAWNRFDPARSVTNDPDVTDPDLRRLISEMVSRDPSARPTADEVIKGLERICP